MAAALLMTGSAGVEGAVAAEARERSRVLAADAPDQLWGSAAGRAHRSAPGDTSAEAAGGGTGHKLSTGELPLASATSSIPLAAPEPALPSATAISPDPVEPEGFDPGTSREIPSERQRAARTFQNTDGTFTTRFYDEPVNFQDPQGNWQEIDTTLQPRVQGGRFGHTMSTSAGGWQITAGDSETTFAGHADGTPLMSLRTGEGTSVGFSLQDAAHVPGEADESTIIYRAVRPSADVRFVAGGTSVKEVLILNDVNAPTEWVFPLHTQGLTARSEATGSVAFVDASGAPRARIPAGWMEDSGLVPNSNQGEISSGVRYELVDTDGGQALKVSLDSGWLNDPERVFPVKVDPTVVTVTSTVASSGTYVQSPYDQNFSGDTNLKVGTYDKGGHKAAAFLRFNGVETSLKNAWVVGARLALYNTWSYSCTARPVTVHAITSNWAESTTSTYPGPATGAALASKSFTHGWRPEGQSSYPCGAAAWESISLGAAGRQLVDDWTHGRKKNYGLAVKASTTDSAAWKNFGSDDYPNGKPSLDVTWTKYGATYKLGEFVTPITATAEGAFRVTVTNRGQETWPKNGNYTLRYLLFDAAGKEITDTSKIRWSPMPADVPPGAAVTLDAKIAPLTPGDYTLLWTMNDNGAATFSGAGVPPAGIKFSAVNIPAALTRVAPASGAVVNSLTPTLWATATDRDRYPKTLQYQFEVCEVEGKNTRKNCRTGPRSTSQQWAVTSGWLSWAKTYAWYAYAYDGSGTSTRPGPSFLTPEVPQPAITGHLGGADEGDEFEERSGNYATAATDAAIPTVGPELSVTRTYNSQDPRQKNAFGAGWATRWDMRALPESDGSVLVTLSDGTQVRFGRNADGSHTAPSGSTGTLKAEAGGGWTLRDASGALYTFDSGGLLTRIADGHGRVQQLAYTSGRLTRATDVVSGRFLDFGWSGGHVTTVQTAPVGAVGTGLTWSYSYDGDRLVKVCPPTSAAACTQYIYEDGSLYRSTVLDANPSSYWRLDEAEGESAASQAVSRTGMNAAQFRDVTRGATGALAGTPDKAGSFDGTDSHLALPDDALGSSPFASVELWFQTTKPGVLLSQADERMEDVDPTVSQSTPLLYVGTDGKLRGQFYFPGTTWTPLTSTGAVTDGAWHHVVLSGAGTSQTLYLDGTAVGSKTGAIDHLEQRYTYVGLGWTAVPWASIDKTDRLGHFTGIVDEVAVYDHTLDTATVAQHYAARGTVPRVTKVTLPSGRTDAEVTYNAGTERVTEFKDSDAGVWKVSAPTYSAGSAAYDTAVRGSGPTEYWRLGERRGVTASSALPEGSDGTYGDGVVLGTFGAFSDGDDTAAGLNGDSYIQVADGSLSGTSLSAELWFRTDKPGILLTESNADISENTVPSRATPLLYVGTDGKLRGQFYSETTNWTPPVSKNAVTDAQWHHAVVTGSGTTSALYVDGVLAGTVSGTITHLDQSQIFLGKGRTGSRWTALDSTDPWGHFSGALDEVAFYPKALTAAEIRDHFRSRTGMVTGDSPHYRGAVTADAPAGYWRLGETSGTQAHSQVAAVDGQGTYTNTALGADGIFGTGENTAVTFNGNGYAEIPGGILRGSTDLAVELWFKTTKAGVLIGDQSAPMGSTVTGTYAPLLYVGTDGKLNGKFFSPGLGTAKVASADTVTDDQWHHAVVTATGTAQTLYLDGVQAATLTGAVSHQSNTRTYIGAGFAKNWPAAPADASYFTGQLDEVAVYQHGLSADQVAEHYNARQYSGVSALASTVTVTDPKGATTSTTYDALRGGRRITSTDANGGLTTYAYDTGGFPHTVTDPNGHATITGHDAQGNPVSRTTCRDAGSCWTSYEEFFHNAANPLDPRNGKTVATRDARSAGPADDRYRTTMSYTALGLPEKMTLADGRTSSTTYTAGTEPAAGGGTTPAGLVATTVTPQGAVTTYAYFSDGDLARTTSPSGLVTTYMYDGIGRNTSETQVSDTYPNGVTTTYAYDDRSHVVAETGAGAKNEITGVTHTAKTVRTYDADGNLLTETDTDLTGGDQAGTTTYHYDSHGQNDTVTDAEGNVTTYAYDTLGRLTGEKDPLGNELAHRYTPIGDLAETVLKNWTAGPTGEPRDLVMESNAYDPAGRLASTTDAMGATTTFTYFDDGLPATTTALQVEQPDGTRRDITTEANTYDGAGHLTRQVTGGGTRTESQTVDATGRVVRSVLDPNGIDRSADYAYDNDDRVTETTLRVSDTETVTERSTYDKAGNITAASLSSATTTLTARHTYDARGLLLSSVSPRGTKAGADPATYTTNYRYDALGRLVEQTSPAVTAETYGTTPQTKRPTVTIGYNTYGDTTDSRDENGETTRSAVDRLGRTVALTLPPYTPAGGGTATTPVYRTAYDALGRVSTTTDPLARTTRYTYDQLGQLSQRTDPPATGATPPPDGTTLLLEGGTTRYTWTPTGLPLSVTTPTGARTETTYDRLGRQLTATEVERHPSPQNLTTRYTWDDADNLTTTTSPSGLVSSATYNAAGEALTTTQPGGAVTRYTYDGLGRQTQIVDPTQRRSTFTYDLLDNVTEATDFGTGTTALRTFRSAFDEEGNQTSATSPTGGQTSFAHDALGRLTQQTEKLTGDDAITTGFGYDPRGNRTRLTDGRSHSVYYTYNAWGLQESTVEPAAGQHQAADQRTWTTVYDAAGQAVAELLPGGVKRQKTYDGLGRLIRETGSGTTAATTPRVLSYDLDGRLTGAGTDGLSPGNTYTYNDRGMLLRVQGLSGTSQYAYDADGNMTTRTDAAGTTRFAYDSTGRLDSADEPLTGTQIQFDHDAAGRPTKERFARVTDTGQTVINAERTYGYDSLGRTTSDTVTRTATGTQVTGITYGYDLADRLLTKTTTGTAGAAANAYTYDLAGRLTSWTDGTTTTPYEWDRAGNLTRRGSTTATYDARNRLEKWGTDTYTYSARGTTETVTKSDGTSRVTASDAFERTVSNGTDSLTYDSLDRVLTSGSTAFTYDGGSNNLVTDTVTAYTRTPDGELLAGESPAAPATEQLAVTDQHTDLVAGLNADGTTVVGSRAYDPFGRTTAKTGSTPTLGYQSGWTDTASGEVNMAARWYQPGTGSFTSRDTWQLDPTPSASANRYTYGDAEPLNGTDPTGHAYDPRSGGGGGRGGGASAPKPARGGGSGAKKPKSSKKPRKVPGRQPGNARSQECSSYSARCRTKPTAPGRTSKPKPSTRPTTPSTSSSTSKNTSCSYRGTCRSTNTPTRPRYNSPSRATANKPGTGKTTPTAPRVVQNPNAGKNPRPAATRPKPRPEVNVGRVEQTSRINAVRYENTTDRTVVVVDSEDPADLLPVPKDEPGGKNDGRKRQDEKCDEGPGVSPTGHAVYLPRERYYDTFEKRSECRATGVYGLLDQSDYNKRRKRPGTNTNDTTQPPGMREIRAQGYVAANGHLIPAAVSGSGIDLRNLVAEYEKANHSYLSYGVEEDIRKAVMSGKRLLISIVPRYGNSGSGIPTEIEYNYGTLEDGNMKHCVIVQSPAGGATRGSVDCPRR
ncbi:LamG-like jellyroll fold domain-containing protein [Streptomyces niveiscabiei]|uniref:LamG-like jellyroll fold domain-containing protein n=4 Tax=Streptomyces niveiscabiei TaxID=164115 RepID=UPI003EB831DF